MTDFVISPPPIASVALAGESARFPVRRIFCVGRNYAAHAREMGKDPDREPPFFFTKPADAVVDSGTTIPYPPETANLHYEIELIVAIGREGFNITADAALDHVFGYGVGIDLTRRDLQAAAKKAGRPWDMAKGFDASAPCSPLIPASRIGHPQKGRIWLEVNGDVRQQGDLDEMIWPVADIIAALSRLVTLAPGDIIFTGTPSGVGALEPGDRVRGGVDGVSTFELTVAPAAAGQ